jgi:hypothetical protein
MEEKLKGEKIIIQIRQIPGWQRTRDQVVRKVSGEMWKKRI